MEYPYLSIILFRPQKGNLADEGTLAYLLTTGTKNTMIDCHHDESQKDKNRSDNIKLIRKILSFARIRKIPIEERIEYAEDYKHPSKIYKILGRFCPRIKNKALASGGTLIAIVILLLKLLSKF